MDVQSFFTAAKAIASMPPFKAGTKDFRKPAIMIRGPHGVGKTDIIHDLGEILAKEVIDVRLGQLTEGDLTGLPFKHVSDLLGEVTRYAPAEFIRIACTRPVIIFFDEMNRAIKEVLQGVFQIVQDGKFQGHTFHPDTLVICAINNGAQYQVTKLDPALKDRFWICDIRPTFDDWIVWAKGPKGNIHSSIIDFHLANRGKASAYFEVEKEVDAEAKYPSRRSWEKLARTGQPFLDILDVEGFDTPAGAAALHTLLVLAEGFVGSETARAYTGFLKARVVLTVDDILNHWDTVGVKKVNRLGETRWIKVKDMLADHCVKNQLTDEQAKNFGKVLLGMPGPQQLALWMTMSNEAGTDNPVTIHNVRTVHPYAGDLFLKAINGESVGFAGALP